MEIPFITLLLHAIATALMTGVIWFVQIVHYPLMRAVGSEQFVTYEAAHRLRTTWVVAPLMFIELATAGMIAIQPASFDAPGTWAWLGFALVVVNWCSTAFIQVPLHKRLTEGFDESAWRRLVSTNWIRTVSWSVRAILALLFLQSDVFG